MDELAELLGESPAIQAVRDRLRRLLDRQRTGQHLPPILIQGETGTGKGLVAHLLHRQGARSRAAFVDVNCAAIPETLIEAELFGFEQGAFTDARRAKAGLFQAAHRGVLFLDEVALLPDSAQGKLLSAIEERTVRRLGSTRSEAADVWLISATNADLHAAVEARRFRQDLYHRVAVLTLELPPLRERERDVLLIAEHFLARACADYGLPPKRLDAAAQSRLLAYAWPGNIRQLGNVIERAALFSDAPVVTADVLGRLPTPVVRSTAREVSPETPTSRDEAMRQALLHALEETGWNISLTATRLGIARNTVYSRLVKFGLQPDRLQKTVAAPPRPSISATDSPPTDTPLHWEPRRLTLLRVDVRGPDGPDGGSRTSRVLDDVIGKVYSFGGRVEEVTSTGLVAAFGLDSAEAAPRRAAHAAMAIQKAAERAGEGNREGPAVAIGLHVAPVLIGRVGPRVEIDAAAKRTQWPILERLLQATTAGDTFATAAAAPFLERRFELTPEDRLGPASRLTGQERRGFGLWGAMTRFVGRREEFEFLRSRLALAESGHGQIAVVVGEAGVGKSRLIYEFTHSHLVDNWLVLETSAAFYGDKVASYLPVADLLRGYWGIGTRDTHQEIRERVTGKVVTLDRRLESALPALLALLDVPVEDPRWRTLDPFQRRQRTLDAVKRLMVRESQARPVLLVFEDLALVDTETQTLLDALVESVPVARLLLLGSYRPEHHHGWGSKTYYSQLRVDSLPADSADALLDDLLGVDPALAPVKHLLAERTARNPLFMEESVRALVEAHVLLGERGAYRLGQVVKTIEVPATVQAILATRIDRLPAHDKRLLETAAVVGKDVPFVLLEAISDLPREALQDGLSRLQAAEFLFETRSSPDPEYTFKHSLTHEVSYDSVLPDDRRALHRRIAAAVATVYAGRLPEHVERLAHHTLRGESWDAAVGYLRQAGSKAMERSAPREAVGWFELALDAVLRLPPDRATLEQAFDIRFDLRHAVGNQGDLLGALKHLRDADRLAEKMGDDRRRGRVYAFMVNNNNLRGELGEAVRVGARALEIAQALGDLELRLLTTTYLEQTYVFLGEYQQAVDLAKANLSILPAASVHQRLGAAMPTAVFDRGWLVLSLTQLGRFGEATEVAEASIRIAEQIDHPYGIGFAYYAAANPHVWRGDWRTARLLYERSVAAIRDGQWRLQLPVVLAMSSWVLARLGDTTEAATRADEAVRLYRAARATDRNGGWAGYLTALCQTYLLLGEPGEALRLVEDLAKDGTAAAEAVALYLQGEIAAHPDRYQPGNAEAHYRQAVVLAENCGLRPLTALCHLGLGRVCRHGPEHPDTHGHLATAMSMFREMHMEFWLEQTEKEARR